VNLTQRKSAFAKLGNALAENKQLFTQLSNNQWFTSVNIAFSIDAWAEALRTENIERWLAEYPELQQDTVPKNIGVISAGNLPLVGFHDMLCVLISGHRYVGKLSSKDDKLPLKVIDLLTDIEPEFRNFIRIEKEKLQNIDAVIATGSNNSARYFEAYFGKYPHIIRRNRNSAAVLSGDETKADLERLADDIFMYFGLGCRNVSKLFVPADFDLNRIFEASLKYAEIVNHNKYANNYDYNRALYLMDSQPFHDNGFMILRESHGLASPVSVVYFERYSDIETVRKRLDAEHDHIQCVVSSTQIVGNTIAFGKTQSPELWDYADNVDTLKFLIGL